MRLALRTTAALGLALLACAPAAHAAGPTPTFAISAQGAFVPDGGFGIVAGPACPGDFNGDGNTDVATPFVTNTSPTASGIVVMDGDGTGHLGAPATPIPSLGGDSTHCAVGDFNGDGRDDIAAVEDTKPGIQIALGNANGTFTTSTVDTTALGAGSPTAIATGDIDGDGNLDLAVTWLNNDLVAAYKGDGGGSFALTGTPVALTDDPTAVTLADVNNDNHDDALVGLLNGATFERASGMADGSLQSPAVGQAVQARSFGVGDYDGDGSVDVAVDDGNFVLIRHGNNSGSFTSSGGTYPNPVNSSLTVRTIATGDYNNDGLPDVAVGSAQAASTPANAWTFAGTGVATSGMQLDTTAEGPYQVDLTSATTRIAAADMNNDGRLDIVAATSPGGKVGVLLNTTPVPGAVTGGATPSDNSASIAGTVSPSGVSTQFGVDLLSPTGTVDRKPAAGTVTGTGSQAVTVVLNSLTPDTTYRYRLYATSPNGTTVGKIRTFHTKIARPGNQSPPQISGNAVTGGTLTCTDGTWTGSPTFGVEWLRGGVVMAGETTHTYTVQKNDEGSTIACFVTATNAGGSASATSPGFVVALASPSNVTPPAVTGNPKVGAPLACNAGTWTAGGSFTYAWVRDGTAIGGATTPGYVVTKADTGHALLCRVTLRNSFGSATADSTALSIPALKCTVPKLRGATLAAAKTKLKAANCGVGRVVKKTGKGVKVGRVLSSSPKAGAVKPKGTKVKLFVRK